MKLTRNIIEIGKKYKTPFLLFDLKQIQENYRKIKKSINGVEIFYAVKANDHPRILEVLKDEGSSFEISSLNELKSLLKLHIPVSKIMCLNPIKSPEFLEQMHKLGLEMMAYDSLDEIDKIAEYAPNSKVILRIVVNNEGSDWPLTKKFGVDAAEAIGMLKYAKKKKIQPIGLTFHVGSQCLNKNNWASALYICEDIWNRAKKENISLSLISLGGGIPIGHTKPIPEIKAIGDSINEVLETNFKPSKGKFTVTIEPGRGMVGNAAIMVSTVVGKAKRGNEDWIYLDVGVFNGLMETVENFMYELKTDGKRKNKKVTIGGPSCDSVDITFKNIILPDVKIGDRVYIINAGAYTTAYAACFNGFNIPGVYFLEASK